jgi:hypothetical protein
MHSGPMRAATHQCIASLRSGAAADKGGGAAQDSDGSMWGQQAGAGAQQGMSIR